MYRDSEDIDSRAPTELEQKLLAKLLAEVFPGAAQLRQQQSFVYVSPLDDDGSLRLRAQRGTRAEVVGRIPVEASYIDADGVTAHVLLHIIDGFLDELEVYRDDSSRVIIPAVRAPILNITSRSQ